MPYALPHRHRFAYQYSLFLHDLVVGLSKSALESEVFQVDFELTDDELEEFATIDPNRFYEWIGEKRGRSATALMSYVAIIGALLPDFCHFVLEGLRASAKGKLTVAYALLRKPLKDNLFFFEWMLADPAGFIDCFQNRSPDCLEEAATTPAIRDSIVASAFRACQPPGLDLGRLISVRYDKADDRGLAAAWDQAIHLVTSRRHVRTAPENINFVFSGEAELQTQWANVFWTVPYVLYYSTFIIHELMSTIAEIDKHYLATKGLRRAIGWELWAEYTRDTATPREFHPSLQSLIKGFEPVCPACSATLALHRRNLRSFGISGLMRCRSCRAEARVDRSDSYNGARHSVAPGAQSA